MNYAITMAIPLLVVCMLIQHVFITNVTRTREHFYRDWKNYRNHIMACRVVSIVGIIMAATVLFETGYETANRPATHALTNLISSKAYTTLILLTFFLSVLKFLIEDQMEKKMRRASPHLKNVWLNDIWLLWFFASAVATSIIGIEDIFTRESIGKQAAFYALGTILLVILTYNFWIYNVLHRQLTEGDGFMSSAVSQIYGKQESKIASAHNAQSLRGFLGFLYGATQAQPPAQILVIGPKGAGKTHWIASQDGRFAAQVERDENGAIISTESAQVATKIESIPITRNEQRVEAEFCLSIVDFPGENIGDHCTLPFEYRSDVLLLMLPENAFSPELDQKEDLFDIQKSEDITEYFKADAKSSKVRDYLYALYFGLNIDDKSKEFEGRQAFGVGSFVLTINSLHLGGTLMYDSKFEKHMKNLSVQIGKKFGVEEERCLVYYYNIDVGNVQILRHAIGSLHEVKSSDTT